MHVTWYLSDGEIKEDETGWTHDSNEEDARFVQSFGKGNS
jgi:hypothetical protein